MKKLHSILWKVYAINWKRGKFFVVGETKRIGFNVVNGKFRAWWYKKNAA